MWPLFVAGIGHGHFQWPLKGVGGGGSPPTRNKVRTEGDPQSKCAPRFWPRTWSFPSSEIIYFLLRWKDIIIFHGSKQPNIYLMWTHCCKCRYEGDKPPRVMLKYLFHTASATNYFFRHFVPPSPWKYNCCQGMTQPLAPYHSAILPIKIII